jgi:hypothetical protein
MKQTERVYSPEDLSNETPEIVKVSMDAKGGVMFIGSLSAEEFTEWQSTRDSKDPEAKKNASAILMARSLVKGPDKNPDGTPLSGDALKAASQRTGTDAHVALFRKAKVAHTERLLKAILKLNYINQEEEVATKNA